MDSIRDKPYGINITRNLKVDDSTLDRDDTTQTHSHEPAVGFCPTKILHILLTDENVIGIYLHELFLTEAPA